MRYVVCFLSVWVSSFLLAYDSCECGCGGACWRGVPYAYPVRPDMKVTVLADPYRNVEGGEIRINDFFKSGNRLLVLIFWAPWCPSCQASLPSILQKAEALAKLNGMLVGVSVEENEDKVRVSPMIQTMAGRIPCLMDSKGRLQEFFKVGIIPFAVAINAEGETVGSGRPEEVFESLGVGEDERSVQ